VVFGPLAAKADVEGHHVPQRGQDLFRQQRQFLLACLALAMLQPPVVCWALLYYSARRLADRIRETEEALASFEK